MWFHLKLAIFSPKIPNFQFWNYFGPFEVQFDPVCWLFLFAIRKITSLKVDGRMIQTVWNILNRVSGWQFRHGPPDALLLDCLSQVRPLCLYWNAHFGSNWLDRFSSQGITWSAQSSTSSSCPYFRGQLVRFLLPSPNFWRQAVLCPTRDLFRTKDPYFPWQRNSVSFLSFLKV